jgi:glycosyltransferase involved in cell wall biosynthesis
MSPRPTVSVIIPAFNRSNELRRALDSLTQQTDSDFEVCICDDGSTEDVQGVVADFQCKLPINFTRIDASGGPARPRNIAVAQAKGDWVSFLDSDDWWKPERITSIKSHLIDGVDVVYHPLSVQRLPASSPVRTKASSYVGAPVRGADAVRHMIRVSNPIATSGAVVRTSLMHDLGGFCEKFEFRGLEDFDLWLRLAIMGARFKFVNESLGFYWIGQDNISQFTQKRCHAYRLLYERFESMLPDQYKRLARSNFNYLLGSYELALGVPDSGRLAQVELFIEPGRWAKAQVKRFQRASTNRARTN